METFVQERFAMVVNVAAGESFLACNILKISTQPKLCFTNLNISSSKRSFWRCLFNSTNPQTQQQRKILTRRCVCPA